MLEKVRTFETWVIDDFVSPASWALESWTGFNNFQQARFMLLIWLILEVLWNQWIDKGSPVSYTITFVFCIGLFVNAEYCERMSRSGVVPIARFASAFVIGRITGWAALVLSTYNIFLLAFTGAKEGLVDTGSMALFVHSRTRYVLLFFSAISLLIFLYLLARNPMPPQQEKKLVPQRA